MSVDEDRNIGQQFGNYRLVRRLGSGGFASVYLGQHVRVATQQAAVKILHLFDVNTENFQQEAETTASLVHPHIVRLFDFDLHQGTPFLIMDYAPHGSLRNRHPQGTVVPLATVVQYVKEIAPALQYAHDHNIIHRDIKPENVLIGLHNELLLGDFGIALLSKTGRTSLQNANNVGGTAEYMAPEMFSGKPEKASDQYSLGIMVYEWLCGTPPYSEGNFIQLGYQHNYDPKPSLREKLPELAPGVEAVVMKALAKEPQKRFASVQQFAEKLEKAAQPPIRIQSVPLPETLAQVPLFDVAISPPVRPIYDRREEVPVKSAPSQGTSRIEPLVATVPYPSRNSTRTKGFTRNRVVLLGFILVLFLGSIGWLVPTVNTYFTTIHATATAEASRTAIIGGHVTATAEVRATVSAAEQAYAAGTTQQGVMFGFDSAHTHWNRYERVLNASTLSRLKPLWSYTTGNFIYSSPAIAGGMLYVGSQDYKLYAFDATCRQACQPLWSYTTGGPINSSPAIAGGLLYVGSDDNKLYAFDATCRQTCQPLWSYTTRNAIGSSPAIVGGMLYIGSNDGKLYAFDATCRQACQPVWSYTNRNVIDSFVTSPAVADGMLYIGTEDGKLYAFDATCRQTCQPLWSYTTGSYIYSSPTIAGGLVYIGSFDDKLYAFDATCRQACQPLWSYTTGSYISTSSPAAAGGIVYIGSRDGKLYAFDATCRQACQPLWSYTAGNPIFSSPAVAGGLVYMGLGDGKLYAFDATCRQACQPLWSYTAGNSIFSSPAIANGMLYVSSDDHKLYAFGLAG